MTPRPMREVSFSYSLFVAVSFACVLHLAMSSSALHLHVFQTCIRPGSPVSSVVRSEPRNTRTRPRHVRILFYKWRGKCSRNGLKVGVRSYFSVGRPSAKFHRIRSPSDAPTINYSSSIVGLLSDVFGLRELLPGFPLFPS